MVLLPEPLRARLGNSHNGDLIAAEEWMNTPHPRLDDQTPLQAWQRGQHADVANLIADDPADS